MTTETPSNSHLAALRPLVRYVDEDRAVVDLWVRVAQGSPPDASPDAPPASAPDSAPPVEPTAKQAAQEPLALLIQVIGPDQSEFDLRQPLAAAAGEQVVRFEIVCPERWWPAGLGEQFLYQLSATLVEGEHAIDRWESVLGLTSVRQGTPETSAELAKSGRASRRRTPPGLKRQAMVFVVNGQPLLIRSVTPVGPAEEHQLLPVAGDSLLMVHDYFGPRKLYDAADRAGILVVQSVPEDAVRQAQWDQELSLPVPQQGILEEVDRLTSHPSLAGWFVGHLGSMTDLVSRRLRELDPTHPVLVQLPLAS